MKKMLTHRGMIDGKMLNFLFEYWPATPATREEPETASDIEIIQITDMEGNNIPIPSDEYSSKETVLDRMTELLLDAVSNNDTNEIQVNAEDNMTFLEEINDVIDNVQDLQDDCYKLSLAFNCIGNDKTGDKLYRISTELNKQIQKLASIRANKVKGDLNNVKVMNQTLMAAMLRKS